VAALANEARAWRAEMTTEHERLRSLRLGPGSPLPFAWSDDGEPLFNPPRQRRAARYHWQPR
jgi:hypothetical protein